MTVTIKTKKGSTMCFGGVWETQDNGHKEFVVKQYDHECFRINENEIESIDIKLGENK